MSQWSLQQVGYGISMWASNCELLQIVPKNCRIGTLSGNQVQVPRRCLVEAAFEENRLRLDFLPPYSPELNPIERV